MKMLPDSMQAVVIVAAQQAELQTVECDASSLHEDEICGQTEATLISPGTELSALYVGGTDVDYKPTYPARPGYAAVMRIDAIGSGVANLAIGDRVLTMGPHASRQRCKAVDAHRLPEGLPSHAGVFARLMGVSWSTLVTTTARPADRVLVMGLGPVGNLAAQMFSASGFRVTACDPIESRRTIAHQCGLTDVRSTPSDAPARSDDNRTTSGDALLSNNDISDEPYALAIDCSGHEQAVLDSARHVRKRGEVVLVGVPWKRRTEIHAYDLLNLIFHKYLVVRSGWEWELPVQPREFSPGSISQNLRSALRWLGEGKVKTDGLSDLFSPRDAQRAYQDLMQRRNKGLSVVFDWKRA